MAIYLVQKMKGKFNAKGIPGKRPAYRSARHAPPAKHIKGLSHNRPQAGINT